MSDFTDPDFEDGWTRHPSPSSATAALSREIDTLRAVCDSNKRAYAGAVKAAMAADERAEKAEAELAALKTIATGYCPHCGRGDCSPTADQWAEQRQRAEKAERAVDHLADRYRGAEDAIARVRALHAPTANLSWPAFSCTCESVSTHTRACSQCQRCHPCPTLRALDGTT